MQQPTSLMPFRPCPAYKIIAQHQTQNQQLTLNYDVYGDIAALDIGNLSQEELNQAEPSPHGQRRDLLWQHTCFECFIAEKNQPTYFEYNFCPTGDWNTYQFEDYRLGMCAADVCMPEISFVQHSARHFHLQAIVELPADRHAPCHMAVSVILKHGLDNYSYWALQHSAAQADFHQRQDFVLCL